MKKQQSSLNKWASLRHALSSGSGAPDCFLAGPETTITQSDFVSGSALFDRGVELSGRCVLVATTSQLIAASALIELDGLARRIVVCPPDISLEHLPYVMDTAAVDVIVSDRAMHNFGGKRPLIFSPCSRTIVPRVISGSSRHKTEWILLTSGTTGAPKLVVHTLESLAGAIVKPAEQPGKPVVWSTFYDVRRYGGLQILLRAVLTGASLVLSDAREPIQTFLARAAAHGVTHISGTPSHWRRVLMSSCAQLIEPEYIRLSGEIADQAILNSLRAVYPHARIVHAFASTEAGVAFEVTDGLAGFPTSIVEQSKSVEMKVEDGSLRIRSNRNASCYLGQGAPQLKASDGFIDSGDMLELRNGRYYFSGRRDGVINIGGLKVHPEEIESVINRHPAVWASLVRTKKNPITGALVVADVVLQHGSQNPKRNRREMQDDILMLCRESLSSYKIPAAINFISDLSVSESGKVLRRNA